MELTENPVCPVLRVSRDHVVSRVLKEKRDTREKQRTLVTTPKVKKESQD